MDECSCKCYFEAAWGCEGTEVACSVRESDTLALRTVGDLVCSSRGTEKPAYEDLAQNASFCKPLPTERGSAPPRQCTSNSTRIPTPVPTPLDPNIFKIEQATAFRFAIVALVALFA